MSLAHPSNIPGAGVVPTASNGIEGVGSSDNANDDDPSKPKKESTFSIVVRNSVWLLRTVYGGEIWYALSHTFVEGQKLLRKTGAMLMNGVGFAYSVGVELLLTSRNEYKNQWLPLVEELNLFLVQSGIAVELARGFANYRFLSNVAILARIHDRIMKKHGATGPPEHLDRRRMALQEGIGAEKELTQEQSAAIIDEGQRFMRYTTAAYGTSMINAAEIDVYGDIKTPKEELRSHAIAAGGKLLVSLKSSLTTSQQERQLQSSMSFFEEDSLLGRMSEHIGIPEEDIYLMNLKDNQAKTLRFFIAVDHAKKAVVLSIRGTLTVKEILIDIAGFARPFCGGEAHSEMANTAEKIWEEAMETVTKLLGESPTYELVLAGHSLGAGAAALLNILLHQNNRERVGGRAVRCFAFAPPPVFAGTVSDAAGKACTSYIHDSDVVPFLSVDSVRRVFAALHAVEESYLSVWFRTLIIIWGQTEIVNLPTLIRIESALHDPLPVKEGAPELMIPAHINVWMRSDAFETNIPRGLDPKELKELNPSSPSNFILADSEKLVRMGISLDPRMITDHFPNGYESALHNLR